MHTEEFYAYTNALLNFHSPGGSVNKGLNGHKNTNLGQVGQVRHQQTSSTSQAQDHIKLYQKALASQVCFSSTNLTHTILKKEKDLTRQIKSEVNKLKADFLANQITDYLKNNNWKPLKRSRGQSIHIDMACQ